MKMNNEKLTPAQEEMVMATNKKQLKAIKRKVDIKTALSVTESIAATAVTGICIGVTSAIVKDEESSKELKAVAIGTSILATGLLSGQYYRTADTVSFKCWSDKMYKVLSSALDTAEKVMNDINNRSKTKSAEIKEESIIDFPIITDETSEKSDIDNKDEKLAILDKEIESSLNEGDELGATVISSAKKLVEDGDIDMEVKEDGIHFTEKNVHLNKVSPIFKHATKKNKENQ